MARFKQHSDGRGSLKWIQRAVNPKRAAFEPLVLRAIPGASSIEWKSPLETDDFAEYRDAAFLERIGHGELAPKLAAFWPSGGPQWDALGLTDWGDVLLIEAKAHIGEMCSSPTQASDRSRLQIEASLKATVDAYNIEPRAPWAMVFYQLANRLAHLHFLHSEGVPAWLVLAGFLGDEDVEGPDSVAEWKAAYKIAFHVMGIGAGNRILRHVVHVHPHVRDLA